MTTPLPLAAVRFPHPRGDGPGEGSGPKGGGGISPPAWGWPVRAVVVLVKRIDFPTRVGMARAAAARLRSRRGFPHPRGDGPLGREYVAGRFQISPPAWGWPVAEVEVLPPAKDFPTRVGMARVPT